ncbi:MAG: alpha-amylase family glycosyl hydrolase [Alphaproteobacteria bacterium]
MTISAQKIHSSTAAKTALRTTTKERIERLLVQHEVSGRNRGLFPVEKLPEIMTCLDGLAHWLAETKPELAAAGAKTGFDETTVLCISYVDHVACDDTTHPAVALQKFFNSHLAGLYSHLHILPHFPSPTIHEGVKGPAGRADGGFEAMNYRMDPLFGTPKDLQAIKARLMFDFVLNHLSAKGELFHKFIEDVPGYENAFIHLTDDEVKRLDLAPVFRPREHHPIIPFTSTRGTRKNVWCTFSETQADINILDPKIFCLIMESLVKDFVAEGASWIRLDAVGYLVKMLGLNSREASTDCFGIPETHNILKAMRCFFDDAAPGIALVPEVNATGEIIATYYGENDDEGHIVYDFPSAPISLYTIYREDAVAALEWARKRTMHPERIGLSFTNTHDGIGVLPMAEVQDAPEGRSALDFFVHHVERRGGGINYKAKMVDGKSTRIPYEACITWTQAILTPPELASLKGNRLSEAERALIVDRFMASQSFIYSGPHCVPADYMGMLTTLLNDEELYQIAGHRRNKNRGLVDADAFEKALRAPETSYEWLRHAIFKRKQQFIHTRQLHPAFSPYAPCQVDVIQASNEGKPVFSVLRQSPKGDQKVLALTNCTHQKQKIRLQSAYASAFKIADSVDILATEGKAKVNLAADGTLELQPYQVAWLKVG